MGYGAAVLVFVALCAVCYGAYWLFEEFHGESTAAAVLLWVLVFGVGGFLITHAV